MIYGVFIGNYDLRRWTLSIPVNCTQNVMTVDHVRDFFKQKVTLSQPNAPQNRNFLFKCPR